MQRGSEAGEADLWRSAIVAGLAGCLLLVAGSAALAAEANPPPSRSAPRVRLGVSAGLGTGSYGLADAESARGGIQITPFLAASYQNTRAGSSDFWGDNKDNWTSHALLVEFMAPEQMFAIGAGPSLAKGTVESGCFMSKECNPPRSSDDYRGLGLDGRLAHTFGANRPTIRGGFTLELSFHMSPHSDLVTLGIGLDLF